MPTKQLSLYKGICITASGHMRYSSPLSLRGKYVHRVMAAQLVEETCWSTRLLLPLPYEVHHIDYNKQHNCPCNFLFLSEAFHSVLTASGRQRVGGKFRPKWRVESVEPQWKQEEVPF